MNLDLLIPQPSKTTDDSWRWGSVTGVGPLRIKLDGDSSPLPYSPDSLASGLVVGDRVWVQNKYSRLIVIGRSNASGHTDSGWFDIAPAYGFASDTEFPMRGRRFSTGQVSLEGRFVYTGSGSQTWSSGDTILTLPDSKLYPERNHAAYIAAYVGSFPQELLQVEIRTDGAIVFRDGTSSTTFGNGSLFDLELIHYTNF